MCIDQVWSFIFGVKATSPDISSDTLSTSRTDPKMFLEIHPNDLEDGTKYAILTSYNVGMYTTGTFKRCKWSGLTVENTKEHENENIYNILLTMRNKNGNPNFFAFVPKKEKIQQAMEKRSLDKILNRLINDDFAW